MSTTIAQNQKSFKHIVTGKSFFIMLKNSLSAVRVFPLFFNLQSIIAFDLVYTKLITCSLNHIYCIFYLHVAGIVTKWQRPCPMTKGPCCNGRWAFSFIVSLVDCPKLSQLI